MIENIIKEYRVQLEDKKVVLQVYEDILKNCYYRKNEYDRNMKLINSYNPHNINVWSKFNIEKDKYDKKFEEYYF